MILTTKQIVDLLRSREDVRVVEGDTYCQYIQIEMMHKDAKKFTIIVNNTDDEAINRHKSLEDHLKLGERIWPL
jgi:predicted GNAT family N-acyltransferase